MDKRKQRADLIRTTITLVDFDFGNSLHIAELHVGKNYMHESGNEVTMTKEMLEAANEYWDHFEETLYFRLDETE